MFYLMMLFHKTPQEVDWSRDQNGRRHVHSASSISGGFPQPTKQLILYTTNNTWIYQNG